MVGIVYGALMCLAQRDIKKLIAYRSVSPPGLLHAGHARASRAEGATGAAYQMLNHGVSTGALFLLFGMLYERRHARLISDYGGIAKVMPVFTAVFLIITFSSVAVPGTNGFVGEFLVLLGTFKSALPLVVRACSPPPAVILGAAYMLWMVQRVFFGPLTRRENQGLRDLNLREIVTALPLRGAGAGDGPDAPALPGRARASTDALRGARHADAEPPTPRCACGLELPTDGARRGRAAHAAARRAERPQRDRARIRRRSPSAVADAPVHRDARPNRS